MRVGDDGVPPHIMWPEPGSGFEAFPGSPAGQAQAGWLFTRRLIGLSGRRGQLVRVVIAVALAMWLAYMLWWLVTLIL